jgi:hypothetical protein
MRFAASDPAADSPAGARNPMKSRLAVLPSSRPPCESQRLSRYCAWAKDRPEGQLAVPDMRWKVSAGRAYPFTA